eukprot:TRINITY_DN2156_c0_g1_i11.p4 TRINITY_DN2156_c0_g1~~TRINITY_DN2156_c0_g1_i11.p4  ORF type:complete len:139 (-),score=5.72 TRINITY_DN2156_c0_g1_i11:221-637(-)
MVLPPLVSAPDPCSRLSPAHDSAATAVSLRGRTSAMRWSGLCLRGPYGRAAPHARGLLPNVLQRAPRVEERKTRRRQPRHGIVDLPRHLGADHVKADKQRAPHKERIVVKEAVRHRRPLQRRLVRRKSPPSVARLVPP